MKTGTRRLVQAIAVAGALTAMTTLIWPKNEPPAPSNSPLAAASITPPLPSAVPLVSSIEPATWVENISPETRSTRPNLLLVVYDARRRDDFSFGRFGNQRGDTPFLARFANNAALFEEAISPGCWTVPVHASMFSGLSICEIGNDYFNEGFATFPNHFRSLAEILQLAGYRTIALPDHPYFYDPQNPQLSLMRGFEHFDAITDFQHYGGYTNIGTSAANTEQHHPLEGMPELTMSELRERIAQFNGGKRHFDLATDADHEKSMDRYFAKLSPLFDHSPYFRKRYDKAFAQTLPEATGDAPFFLFLNLHMCTIARPDPGLYSTWFLTTLMMNAQHQGASLSISDGETTVEEALVGNWKRLHLDAKNAIEARTFVKHVFDNRFYDANFEAVWQYLRERGLTENLATVVTSDHGLGLSEQGERFYFHGGARPHEYMTQVPLVLRLPEKHAAMHGAYNQRVSLIDIFPTFIDLGLGDGVFERPLPVRGRNLLDRIRESDFESVVVAESAMRPAQYSSFPDVAGYAKAVYMDRFKLIHAPHVQPDRAGSIPYETRIPNSANTPKQARAVTLLYDLEADPHERMNLASRMPGKVKELVSFVDNWSCQSVVPRSEQAPGFDKEALETLRSLGYIE
jgi:arylsulfatase A-like enzyme